LKPVKWLGRTKEELAEFPRAVRREIGYALSFAQAGDKHPAAKPLSGFGGAGVLEIVEDYDGDTYRAVYTVKFAGAVYVLHVFQKKAKRRIATPKKDVKLIRSRLREAHRHHRKKVEGIDDGAHRDHDRQR